MSKVKTGLSGMNVPDEIAFAKQVVVKMTANPNFTTPAPALTAITTAATALENAYTAALAARASSKQATSDMRDKQAALTALLIAEAAYVQTTSAGDTTKIESSGFDVAKSASPIGDLPAP